MRIVAFAGPSLTREDRDAHPTVGWRGPAEAGDLLSLDVADDDIVCLIDGYFDHRPAVRHKEILLLLSHGVTVIGAASIGALRAAEMDSFGMIGIGVIYRAYSSGRITADDEVALVHAPADWGWKPLSLPLVDCRAALHDAVRRRSIAAGEARHLITAARRIHYSERDWPAVIEGASLERARKRGVLERLTARQVSQKRRDALACLAAAKAGAHVRKPLPPMVWTSLVIALIKQCGLKPQDLQRAPAARAARPSP